MGDIDSDLLFIKNHLPTLDDRQRQSILDAIQYVEQLGAYGRSGHLHDMAVYALIKALEDKQVELLAARAERDELILELRALKKASVG